MRINWNCWENTAVITVLFFSILVLLYWQKLCRHLRGRVEKLSSFYFLNYKYCFVIVNCKFARSSRSFFKHLFQFIVNGNVKFSHVDFWSVMKFLLKCPKEIHEFKQGTLSVKCSSSSFGEKCKLLAWCSWDLRCRTFYGLVVGISMVSDPEIIHHVPNLIWAERWISARRFAQTLEIMGRFREHKLSAKWVLKCLNTDRKWYRIKTFKLISQYFQRWFLRTTCYCLWNMVTPKYNSDNCPCSGGIRVIRGPRNSLKPNI